MFNPPVEADTSYLLIKYFLSKICKRTAVKWMREKKMYDTDETYYTEIPTFNKK